MGNASTRKKCGMGRVNPVQGNKSCMSEADVQKSEEFISRKNTLVAPHTEGFDSPLSLKLSKPENDRLTEQEIEHLQNLGELYYWNRELGDSRAIPSQEDDIDPMEYWIGSR